MPKVINIHPMSPDCKLDGMIFIKLEGDEPRYLSPELTEAQAARYLTIPGFIAELAEKSEGGKPEETQLPEGEITETKPPVEPIKPEVKQEKPATKAKGGDAKLTGAAAAKAAKTQTPARETPAQRKARLAAESESGAK